jgi:glycosyltransferase involved in cell wall biosynthesis
LTTQTDTAPAARTDTGERPRVALVVTSTLVVRWFLLGHIRKLAQSFEVTLIVNDDAPDLAALLPCRIVSLRLERDIAPLADLRALAWLWRHFRAERYQLVQSITPKGGLLGMLAARLAGVPARLHIYTGQVWATRDGPMRTLLKAADRLISASATQVLADSFSQRDFLVAQGVVNPARISVLGLGSVSGVNADRFRPDAAKRAQLRAELGIAESATLFLYLGRLKRDKGVLDLARAFALCAGEDASSRLLMIGPDEDRLLPEVERICAGCRARLHVAGYSGEPERYLAASDVLCLPSYREGFGVVILEAAAAGLPAVGSRIYGITDAIVEGETGLLFEAGDVQQLALCLRTLAGDAKLRSRMGLAARERALRDFAEERLTGALLALYRQLLADRPA